MDATEGVLATVMLWVDQSAWRGRCGDSIPTEWVTYHDNVVARDKIVRVRYESISLRKTQDRKYFDGRGFGKWPCQWGNARYMCCRFLEHRVDGY